jgi:hypothetical protein
MCLITEAFERGTPRVIGWNKRGYVGSHSNRLGVWPDGHHFGLFELQVYQVPRCSRRCKCSFLVRAGNNVSGLVSSRQFGHPNFSR